MTRNTKLRLTWPSSCRETSETSTLGSAVIRYSINLIRRFSGRHLGRSWTLQTVSDEAVGPNA